MEERRSDSVMKNEEGSHHTGSKNKKKRMEETCEESPKMKKNWGRRGEYWSLSLSLSQKLARLMRGEGVVT